MTKEEIVALLTQYDVSFEIWGTGGAKTLQSLVTEVEKKEAVLVPFPNVLERHIRPLGIDVFYRDGDRILRLKESHQIYKIDGREVHRGLKYSIHEKLLPGELAIHGAIRALKEEVKILNVSPERFTAIEIEHVRIHPSHSYPSNRAPFPTRATENTFVIWLIEEEYKPEGYIEIEEEKTIYFVWEEYKEENATT